MVFHGLFRVVDVIFRILSEIFGFLGFMFLFFLNLLFSLFFVVRVGDSDFSIRGRGIEFSIFCPRKNQREIWGVGP